MKNISELFNAIAETVKSSYVRFAGTLGIGESDCLDSQKGAGNFFGAYALYGFDDTLDVNEFLSSDITEGSGDRGIDFCHIDTDESGRKAYIGQIFFPSEWGGDCAPTTKISLLTDGIAWLLDTAQVEKIGNPRLRAKSIELLEAIRKGAISDIEILYAHNCHEHSNVRAELRQCVNTTLKLVRGMGYKKIDIHFKELGLESIHESHQSHESIRVKDVIRLPEGVKFSSHRDGQWEAIITSVPCSWVADLCFKHRADLFSANFRGYLGSRPTKSNINQQIQDTVHEQPSNFWIFNNGITAITENIQKDDGGNPVAIKGISIVNGAQTAGALTQAYEKFVSGNPSVMLRIIQCGNNLIDDIVACNNTQNIIRSEDKRSKDKIQIKLHQQFVDIGLEYDHRRSSDRVSTPFRISQLGKTLCAFHIDPQKAFRNAKSIFEDDKVYSRVFPEHASAKHCMLIHALSCAIDNTRKRLNEQVQAGTTSSHEYHREVLQYAAAKYFLLHIMSNMMEAVYTKKISNKFLLVPKKPKDGLPPLVEAWGQLIGRILPSASNAMKKLGNEHNMANSAYEIPRSNEHTKEVAEKVLERFEEGMGEEPDNIPAITKLICLSSE